MNTNDKINQDFLLQYSSVFTEKLLQSAYESKTRLTGKDILNLSSIKQLNLFVIKSFFNEWQEEVKKLKSPLFDYTAAEVRRSMIDFMNTLSQHISIGQEDLKPYVESALYSTILLAKDPYNYLLDEFSAKKSTRITSRFIKSNLKYTVIHKDLLLDFFTTVEGESVRDSLTKAELYFEDSPVDEEVEALLSALSSYLVVEKNDLFIPSFKKSDVQIDTTEESGFEEEEEDQESLTASSSDYFGQSLDTDTPEPVEEEVEEESLAEEHDTDDEESEEWDSSEAEESEKETIDPSEKGDQLDDFALPSDEEHTTDSDISEDQSEISQEAEEESISDEKEDEISHEEASAIAQQEVEDEENVNKKYESDHKTLAELHEDKKIDSVFEAISINHRYMFLQELFDGDNELFTAALKEVDTCETFDQAVEMLVQNHAKEFFWDMNSDEVKELLKVIYRKFRN